MPLCGADSGISQQMNQPAADFMSQKRPYKDEEIEVVAEIRVGVFAPVGPFASATEHHKVELARIGELGVDHVCVNDHVSFSSVPGRTR